MKISNGGGVGGEGAVLLRNDGVPKNLEGGDTEDTLVQVNGLTIGRKEGEICCR